MAKSNHVGSVSGTQLAAALVIAAAGWAYASSSHTASSKGESRSRATQKRADRCEKKNPRTGLCLPRLAPPPKALPRVRPPVKGPHSIGVLPQRRSVPVRSGRTSLPKRSELRLPGSEPAPAVVGKTVAVFHNDDAGLHGVHAVSDTR